ncbi:G-protein coupled receptor 4-like [Rhinatrema bivittatum]|uniref:G-protein coupled receptor 4-like n=1 Tax=Rhinatrema bivittatum TaxID=194408 RepID=UPI001127D000|nr:G-protein coupled receptor 4-like [Rhinatrema bivittatum]XP_029427120.1 G-protein coupled receptor 4-like [Rhinatrema bivittatum]XP_029427121.1 G-protein coupled receptor 4-like [Rhinatrema bivittatum]
MSNESTLCLFPAKYEATLFPVIYSIVFFVGLLGNLTALGVIIHQIKNKNVLGMYLANLCASDLLYIITLPMWIIYTAREDWQFGALSCKILGFFFNANIYTTMAFLSCIAMDRFLATAFPLQSRILRSMKVAALVCAIIWLIVLGSHSVFLSQDELFNASLDVELCYEKYPMDRWMAHINYFRIFVVFLVPFVLLVFSYCSIIKVIRRSPGLDKEKKRKITGLLLAMTIIFIICYFPYHVTLFIRSYISDVSVSTCQIEVNIRPAYRISFALTSLSSALDPFLNVFVSDGVKQDVAEELRTVWLWCTGKPDQTKKQYLKTVCNQRVLANSDKGLLKIQTRL